MRQKSPLAHITLQLLLAIAYVALMRQLLAFGVGHWGESTTGLGHVSRMLLVVSANLAVVFSLNYVAVRSHFYRLGLLIGIAIFGYYYIYNPYGHNYLLVYLGILRSQPHAFNMALLVAAPALVGKLIDMQLTTKKANAVA